MGAFGDEAESLKQPHGFGLDNLRQCPLRLETAHLARRSRATLSRFAADNPAPVSYTHLDVYKRQS